MNDRPKILNINAENLNGSLQFQGAPDVKYCYSLVREYFEKNLLSEPDKLSDKRLQSVLNKRLKDIESFREYIFDNDFRIIELAVLIGLLETLHRSKSLNTNYSFVPAWQLPGQQNSMKKYSAKESWDGFIVGIPKNYSDEAISIPLELKSLMINPCEDVGLNPNDQLEKQLRKFKKYFQHEGSINCVLVMPYTNEKKLKLDLKYSTDQLRSTISPKSVGVIALLTFPHSKDGKLAMSILFALMSWNPEFMSPLNTEQWMCQINFGKSS